MSRFFSLLLLVAMSACAFAPEPFYERDEVPKKKKTEELSVEELRALQGFSEIKAEIINPHCLKCHNPSKAEADVDLSSLQSTLRNPEVVKFGDPDNSSFYVTILEGSMPDKADPLSDELTEKVRLWILNN